ncbi:MAG: AAA family ATPase, partial [Polyangiaceae bacterium]|nr:AAA family ATPase [Polyangiaceae bacterium]
TTFYDSLRTDRPLVGRKSAVLRIEAARQEARAGATWLRIEGEPGVGRSRLLAEMIRRFADQGDLIVGAGPHSSGAPVPYGALHPVVSALLDTDAELRSLVTRADLFPDGLSRAGLEELSNPRGLVTLTGGSDRAAAVAATLAAAVRDALRRERPSRLVLALDDVERWDELSQRALSRLPGLLLEAPVLVLSVGSPLGLDHATSRVVNLEGFSQEEAEEFLRGEPSPPSSANPPSRTTRRLLPLYLDQLLSIGESQTEDSLPLRLADAVAHRVDRLSLQARRVLQAASVLGQRCAVLELSDLVTAADFDEALSELVKKGFISRVGASVDIIHPLVRELVETSI